MTPLLSIIIPFYNLGDVTVRCLRSIYANTRLPYEILVVDNGSNFPDFLNVQRSLELSGKPFKAVRMGSNMGFIRATNAGIREAKGEFAILLNNDTVVSDGWDDELVTPLRASTHFSLTGPVSDSKVGWQNARNINRIWEIGLPVYRTGLDYNSYAKELREKFSKKVLEVPTGPISFFCAAIRRKLFDQIGYLNEDFGIGIGDDDEFCLRARRQGCRIGLCLGSFVAHKHRTTFNALNLSVDSLRLANMEKLRKS